MFPYLPATPEEERFILDCLGLKTADEVFKDIPDSIRVKKKLKLEQPKSELEVERLLSSLSERNLATPGKHLCFWALVFMIIIYHLLFVLH